MQSSFLPRFNHSSTEQLKKTMKDKFLPISSTIDSAYTQYFTFVETDKTKNIKDRIAPSWKQHIEALVDWRENLKLFVESNDLSKMTSLKALVETGPRLVQNYNENAKELHKTNQDWTVQRMHYFVEAAVAYIDRLSQGGAIKVPVIVKNSSKQSKRAASDNVDVLHDMRDLLQHPV